MANRHVGKIKTFAVRSTDAGARIADPIRRIVAPLLGRPSSDESLLRADKLSSLSSVSST
jgi:hypothetical protein